MYLAVFAPTFTHPRARMRQLFSLTLLTLTSPSPPNLVQHSLREGTGKIFVYLLARGMTNRARACAPRRNPACQNTYLGSFFASL